MALFSSYLLPGQDAASLNGQCPLTAFPSHIVSLCEVGAHLLPTEVQRMFRNVHQVCQSTVNTESNPNT